MDESHSTENLRFASSIIARHSSQAVGFAEAVATHFRAAGSDAEARQWASISTAVHDIEQAVPLPNLNPIGWPSGPEFAAAPLAGGKRLADPYRTSITWWKMMNASYSQAEGRAMRADNG